MTKSFDFIFYAQRDDCFRKELLNALESDENTIITTKIHILNFNSENETLLVERLPKKDGDDCKVIPVLIKYHAVKQMLNGDFDHFEENDIVIL